jgi:tetratricopeptide (TPR) repeat protein
MKPLLIIWFLWVGGGDGLLEKARNFYFQEAYEESIRAYETALDRYPAFSGSIHFNLAQCYLRLDSAEGALLHLHQAERVDDSVLQGLAANQIGVVLLKEAQPRAALAAFRRALVADPANEDARFNYELLRRKLVADTPPPPPSNSSPPPPEAEGAPPAPAPAPQMQRLLRWQQPTNSHDRYQSLSDSLTLEQTRELQEQMRGQKTQFLQQLRKNAATHSRKEKRPDW